MNDHIINYHRSLGQESFPVSLEDIDLSGNAVSSVEPFTFERMRDLQSVDLADNLIETIYKDALRVRTPRGEKQ